MASTALVPSAASRQAIFGRGGSTAARCYQCATCSSVCSLTTPENAFPRRQMLFSQWGLGERLASDPAIWLCHQCNDCTVRCPRDARPGDVMQVARSLAVEELAWPRFVGRLVGKAATTWLVLLGVPLVFWIVALYLLHGLTPPSGANWGYDKVVPHWLIYAVYFPTFFLAMGIPAFVGGTRAWKMWGANNPPRSGSFIKALMQAVVDIVVHRKFTSCSAAAQSRRWGHFLVMWGFIAAAAASTFIVIWLYAPDVLGWVGVVVDLPAPITFPMVQAHPFKILGNVAAVALVIGGVLILAYRMSDSSPKSNAFDNLLLAVVLAVIATGVLSEVGRIFFSPSVAMWIYILHLSSVLCLFLSVPYSKFAHLVYRTLAMTHERMLGAKG